MDPAFTHALRPHPQVCLRLRLGPLTLGHWFLLAEFTPSFVDGEAGPPTLEMLPVAALLCAQTPEAGRRMLRRWWLGAFCAFWGWHCRRLNWAEELTRFQEYLRAQMKAPGVNVREDSVSREASAPLGYWLLSVLLAEFHLSLEEALRMPVQRGLCLRAAHAEHLGQITLTSARARRLWDWHRQRRMAGQAASN